MEMINNSFSQIRCRCPFIDEGMMEVAKKEEENVSTPLLHDKVLPADKTIAKQAQDINKTVKAAEASYARAQQLLNQEYTPIPYSRGEADRARTRKTDLVQTYKTEYEQLLNQYTAEKREAEEQIRLFKQSLNDTIKQCDEAVNKPDEQIKLSEKPETFGKLYGISNKRTRVLKANFESIASEQQEWPLDDADRSEVLKFYIHIKNKFYDKPLKTTKQYHNRLEKELSLLKSWASPSAQGAHPQYYDAWQKLSESTPLPSVDEFVAKLNERLELQEIEVKTSDQLVTIVCTENRYHSLVKPIVEAWLYKNHNKTAPYVDEVSETRRDFIINNTILVRVLIDELAEGSQPEKLAEKNRIVFGAIRYMDNKAKPVGSKVTSTTICRDALAFYSRKSPLPKVAVSQVLSKSRKTKLYLFKEGTPARVLSDLCGVKPKQNQDVCGMHGDIHSACQTVTDNNMMMVGAYHQRETFKNSGFKLVPLSVNVGNKTRGVNVLEFSDDKMDIAVFRADYPGDFLQEIQVHYELSGNNAGAVAFAKFVTDAECASLYRQCHYVPMIRSAHEITAPIDKLEKNSLDVTAVIKRLNAIAKAKQRQSVTDVFGYELQDDFLFGKDMGYTMHFSTNSSDATDNIIRPGDDRRNYYKKLGEAIKSLRSEQGKIAIVVVGHTDVRATSAKGGNKTLSQKRAMSYVDKVLKQSELFDEKDRKEILDFNAFETEGDSYVYVNKKKDVYLITIGSSSDFHTRTTDNNIEGEDIDTWFKPDRRAQLFIIVPTGNTH